MGIVGETSVDAPLSFHALAGAILLSLGSDSIIRNEWEHYEIE